MRVLIVGAGIGGLVTALRLHRLGIGCEVVEQGTGTGDPGVGINLLPHAVRELAELGLLERLDETAVRTTDLAYGHRLGQEILRRPCGTDAGWSGSTRTSTGCGPGSPTATDGPAVSGGPTCWSARTASTRRCAPRCSPAGFTRRQHVMSDDELDAVLSGYARASGALRARPADRH